MENIDANINTNSSGEKNSHKVMKESISSADTLIGDSTSDSFLWIKKTKEDFKGKKVGEYEVLDIIGEGGMGYVLSGIQPYIKKKVAIKVLKPELSENQQAMKRFLAEAQAVNAIGHPNIIDIFSFGTFEDGSNYFVMEYLEGQTLDEFLKSKKTISYENALQIFEDIFDALKAAHSKGIVHRDLKPENIFLLNRKNRFFVKLLDFGLAKFSEEGFMTSHTKTGVPVGTPVYMSPEQCMGENVDFKSDIYALGILMYRMFTGQEPFKGSSFLAIITAHLIQEPVPPSSLATMPLELEKIILWCLNKEKKRRPDSVEELENNLIPLLKKIIKTSEDSSPVERENAVIEEPEIDISRFTFQPSNDNFHKKAFYILLVVFIITIGFMFYYIISQKTESKQKLKKDPIPNIVIPKEIIVNKPLVMDVKKATKKVEYVIINLNIKPKVKTTIEVDGVQKKKLFFKLPLSEQKKVKIIVKNKKYKVWEKSIIPAFSQNIDVRLIPLQSVKKDIKPMKKDDLPDVL